MKNTSKKLISMLLVFAMVLSIVPAISLAANAAEIEKPQGISIVEDYNKYAPKHYDDEGKLESDWRDAVLAALPETVKVDGVETPVEWANPGEWVDPSVVGYYAIPGTVNGEENAVTVTVQVREKANLFAPYYGNFDGTYDEVLSQWKFRTEYKGAVPTTAHVLEGTGAMKVTIGALTSKTFQGVQFNLGAAYNTNAGAAVAAVLAANPGRYYYGISAQWGDENGDRTPARIAAALRYTTNDAPTTGKEFKDAEGKNIAAQSPVLKAGTFVTSYGVFEFDAEFASNMAGFGFWMNYTPRHQVDGVTQNAAGEIIYVDEAELVNIDILALENEPAAEMVEVKTELPAFGLIVNYNEYNANWEADLAPATVTVADAEGNEYTANVSWDMSTLKLSKLGKYVITGRVVSTELGNAAGLTASRTILVREKENLLINSGFEEGTETAVTNWGATAPFALKVESAENSNKVLYFERTTASGKTFPTGLSSETLNNRDEAALRERVAAVGAGQYYIRLSGKSVALNDTIAAREDLELNLRLTYYDADNAYIHIVTTETKINSADWTTSSAVFEITDANIADAVKMRARLYTTTSSKTSVTDGAVIVDNYELYPLKVELDEVPADIASVDAETTPFQIVVNYDKYAGANWQSELGLLTEATVTGTDGNTAIAAIEWDYSTLDLTAPGKYTIKGYPVCAEYTNYGGVTVEQTIVIVEKVNLLDNGDFEAGIANFNTSRWPMSAVVDPLNAENNIALIKRDAVSADGTTNLGIPTGNSSAAISPSEKYGENTKLKMLEKMNAYGAGKYVLQIKAMAAAYDESSPARTDLSINMILRCYYEDSTRDDKTYTSKVVMSTSEWTTYSYVMDVDPSLYANGLRPDVFVVAPTSGAVGAFYADDFELFLLKADYVEPAECAHEWDEGVVDPAATCTKDGVITYTCALCNETKTDVVPATGEHAWDEGVIKPDATCTEEGVKTYTCGTCGETKTEAVSALGHTKAEPVIENEKAPTCVAAGSYESVIYCSVCKAELSRETIPGDPATGEHTYDNDQDADCNVCGAEREIEPAECEHAWDDGVETIPAGRDTKGERTYTCGKCGETKKEEIPALLRFASWNVTLKNNIQVNFIGHAANLTTDGYTDMYAVITIESKTEGVTTEVTVYQKDCEIDSQGRPVFSFTELAPDMLSNKITATLYAKHNGREYVSAVIEKDVTGYVDSQLEKLAGATTEKDKKLRTLMVDLLNYATAVQEQSGYKKYPAINSVLTETEKSWASNQEVTAVKDTNLPKTPFEGELLVWKTASLSLGDAVIPYFKFECADLTGITIEVECAGSKYEYACDLAEEWLEWSASDSRYRFNFIDLGVTRMREPIYLTAYKDGVAVSHTLTYSVQSYCDGKLTAGTTLNDVCIAMLKYGDAAKAYVNCPG